MFAHMFCTLYANHNRLQGRDVIIVMICYDYDKCAYFLNESAMVIELFVK